MKHFLTVLKYVLLLSISGALMWYAMRGLKWNDITQAIRSANYWWLGLTQPGLPLADATHCFKATGGVLAGVPRDDGGLPGQYCAAAHG
jgi:hypothetical protein